MRPLGPMDCRCPRLPAWRFHSLMICQLTPIAALTDVTRNVLEAGDFCIETFVGVGDEFPEELCLSTVPSSLAHASPLACCAPHDSFRVSNRGSP
jgi:hypothetical protein